MTEHPAAAHRRDPNNRDLEGAAFFDDRAGGEGPPQSSSTNAQVKNPFRLHQRTSTFQAEAPQATKESSEGPRQLALNYKDIVKQVIKDSEQRLKGFVLQQEQTKGGFPNKFLLASSGHEKSPFAVSGQQSRPKVIKYYFPKNPQPQ